MKARARLRTKTSRGFIRYASGLALSLLAGVTGGCSPNDPAYFPADMILETDGMGTVGKQTIPLKFRPPVASEQKQLDMLTAKLGYPVPWLREDRVHVEIRYTITNLGSAEGQFSLFIDGASEYVRFDYEAVAAVFAAADADPPPVGLIQISNPPILRPGEVYQGIVREDDFHEASMDLDAMGRFMAPFVAVLINRSEVNPIGLEMTPPKLAPAVSWILPALWEITPRFNADQPMTCQILIRVRDDDRRLWENGDNEFAPTPATFTPVVLP
jgi:hypothetical protein